MITGFTKTNTKASLFNQVDIDDIFAAIKTRLSAANVLENSPTVFRFGPAGSVAGQDADDTPFHTLALIGPNIEARAWLGTAGGAEQPGAQRSLYAAGFDTVHFACDPTEGWWWLAGKNEAQGLSGNFMAGCRFRRVAADMTTGLHARFGLLHCQDGYGDLMFRMPYVTAGNGNPMTGDGLRAVSPFGIGMAVRHANSPLPKGIAPVCPAPYGGYSAAVFGDADCAMMATDGFTWGEEAAPGWRVFGFVNSSPDQCRHVALRSPAAFDVLA